MEFGLISPRLSVALTAAPMNIAEALSYEEA